MNATQCFSSWKYDSNVWKNWRMVEPDAPKDRLKLASETKWSENCGFLLVCLRHEDHAWYQGGARFVLIGYWLSSLQ